MDKQAIQLNELQLMIFDTSSHSIADASNLWFVSKRKS
jgi:hypothetical protein